MGDTRDVFFEPQERAVIRTADVYQTQIEVGTTGYSDTLLNIVATFKNSGRPEGFNAQSMVGKSKRGEVALRLFARINPETEVIEQAGFKSRGCLAMTACASVICDLIEGKTLPEALTVTTEDVLEAVDGVPWDKSYTPDFAVEAVRALYGDWLYRNGATLAQLNEQLPCDENSLSCLKCEHCSLRDTRTDLLVDEMVKGREGAAAGAGAGIAVIAEEHVSSDGGVGEGAAVETEEALEPEGSDELDAADRELVEHNAIADLCEAVRAASADSRLSSPAEWDELGLVPAHLSAEDFEMLAYEYLEENTDLHAVAAPVAKGEAAPANPHVKSRFRTATKAVGVPPFAAKSKAEPVEEREANDPSQEPQEQDSRASAVNAASQRPAATNPGGTIDPATGLRIPAGYRLEEIEGELVLVQTDEETAPVEKAIDCEHIRALVGAHSYYLYDNTLMTDAFARWAFLAAEGNPMVTLAECAREECRTYPRPLAAASLANDPFHLDADAVAAAFAAMAGNADFADIAQVQDSKGDLYFYSTDLMSADLAESLAEWYGVERARNV
ncbi:MAG: hypothetical protein HFJ66_07995 [Eggerthellaceae bacterium]|nr:hypothetical protein [Eggerthellaceae bacterium]